MICICAALPETAFGGLLLKRQAERNLKAFIYEKTHAQPFIFNAQTGVFIFLPEIFCEEALMKSIETYLTAAVGHFVFKTHTTGYCFFTQTFQEVLTHSEYSSLVWKNFISSFLIQLKPFKGEVAPIHALFKDFVQIIKRYGTQEQMLYFKKKMDSLRARVELDI